MRRYSSRFSKFGNFHWNFAYRHHAPPKTFTYMSECRVLHAPQEIIAGPSVSWISWTKWDYVIPVSWRKWRVLVTLSSYHCIARDLACVERGRTDSHREQYHVHRNLYCIQKIRENLSGNAFPFYNPRLNALKQPPLPCPTLLPVTYCGCGFSKQRGKGMSGLIIPQVFEQFWRGF